MEVVGDDEEPSPLLPATQEAQAVPYVLEGICRFLLKDDPVFWYSSFDQISLHCKRLFEPEGQRWRRGAAVDPCSEYYDYVSLIVIGLPAVYYYQGFYSDERCCQDYQDDG
jgi:hypothetical protein